MDATQAAVGVYAAGAAGGYILIRGVLARRAQPEAPKLPEPPDRLAPDLAAMLPVTSDTRKDLQKLLWIAGYYRPSALTEYLAVRAVLVLGVVVATTLLAILAPISDLATVLGVGLVASGLAFSMPRVILNGQASARASRLTRGLPLAMDIISLCLTAGQNLIKSLQQTSRELARSSPDLSLELQIVQQQASMHSLEQALMQWAERLDIAEIRSLALLLVQSEKLGTDMVNTLLEVADSQRTVQKQLVEAQANRANFWMLFPTLFCLWVASAIILVGPVYIEFWQYRREQMSNLIRSARGEVERSRNNTTTATPPSPGEAETAPAPPDREP